MTASDKTKDGGSLPALTWRTVWSGEWTCDSAGYIWADSLKGGRTHMIDVRGWGYLTGGGLGALGLKATDAERLQDDLGRLLCAAPDLLEAALAVEALWEGDRAAAKEAGLDFDEEQAWASPVGVVWKQLRAAIAKATTAAETVPVGIANGDEPKTLPTGDA